MFKLAVLNLCVGLFISVPSFAKEMSSRLGVGFRNAYSIEVPSIAAVYYPSANYGIVGAIGVDTQDQASKSAFSVGIRRILFMEDNMNFFMGGQATMLSNELPTETQSGFELSAIVGGELFFAGLENLGFSFETGVGITSLKKTRFRTLGDSPFRAGMIFYF